MHSAVTQRSPVYNFSDIVRTTAASARQQGLRTQFRGLSPSLDIVRTPSQAHLPGPHSAVTFCKYQKLIRSNVKLHLKTYLLYQYFNV